MQMLPDTTLGNFFNQQQRATSNYQWVGTISMSRQTLFGEHYLKAGIDLLQTDYDGTSLSRPVIIERPDGTVTRRLDFTGASSQEVPSTDAAFFLQDRLQPNPHWYVEFGGRVDRDGVLGEWNVTPRVGTALVLDDSGDMILRGGWGLFYERTPSTAGAFDQFETATDTRFDAGPAPGDDHGRPRGRTRPADGARLCLEHQLQPPREPLVVVACGHARSPRLARAHRQPAGGRRWLRAAAVRCRTFGLPRRRDRRPLRRRAGERHRRDLHPLLLARRSERVHHLLRRDPVSDRRREPVRRDGGRRAQPLDRAGPRLE